MGGMASFAIQSDGWVVLHAGQKVIEFLKDHADEAVAYIQKSGVADKLPGGLGAP